MQPHIWYCNIIHTIQSEVLVQVFSLHDIVRYYWVNRFKITINTVPKKVSYLRQINLPTLTESTISHSNPQYLGLAYFE